MLRCMHVFNCNSHYVDYHLMFKSIHFVSISLLFFADESTDSSLLSHSLKLIQWLLMFSHSVMSDSLRLHGLKHARPPCPSPTLELAQTHIH